MKVYTSYAPNNPDLDDALSVFDADRSAIGHELRLQTPVARVYVTSDGWVEAYDLPDGRRYVASIQGGYAPPTTDMRLALNIAGADEEQMENAKHLF